MRTTVVLIALVLAVGGLLVCMTGMLWSKIAELMYDFGRDVNLDTGGRIAMVGLLMFLAGVGLSCLLNI